VLAASVDEMALIKAGPFDRSIVLQQLATTMLPAI